jgi:hypothetical protein
MKSVVITTDIFRCREFGLQSVTQNAYWLRGLLHNVFLTTDFVQTVFTSECDEGSFEVARYRRRHNLPSSASSWAKLVNMVIPAEDESYFSDLLGAKLVIGLGVTPALMQLLDRHQIPFVDVEVDSIRFSDDLLLRVRTNSPHLSEYFSCVHLEEAIFSTSIAELRASVARREATTVTASRSFGLFVGQCGIDLSTVKSGCIAKPSERIKEIRAIAQSVDTLFVKPHPYDNDMRHIAILLDDIPNARLTRSNIYRILSDINLRHVVALSSSVLHEAALFGVKTTKLIEPDRDASDLIPPSISRWYRVPTEEMTHEGFVDAFLGKAFPRRNAPRRRLDLRRSLRTSWGLEDFQAQARLPLSMESHQPSIFAFPSQKVGRALRSIFS